MVRLSLHFGVPVHEVLEWPEWVPALYSEFLSREPAPLEKLEVGLASLASLVFNRTRGQGEEPRGASDFMQPDPFKSPKKPKVKPGETLSGRLRKK